MKKPQRRHSEEMRLYWLLCPTFKGHQSNIVEDCDFTISLRFQRVGSKGSLMLAYHLLCDFSFSNKKKTTKQEREQWWRARKQWESLIQSLLISMTAGAGLSQGQDSHRRGIRRESKIHHQGNELWADQENLDPILELFLVSFKQRNNEQRHRYLFSLQYIFLDLFSFAVAKHCCSSRSKLNKGFYSVPYHVSVLQVVCLE